MYGMLMRFLSDDRYAGQDKHVRIRVGREGIVHVGQAQEIRVSLKDKTFMPISMRRLECKLKDPSGDEISIVLPSIREGVFQAQFVFDMVGVYSLTFEVDDETHEYRFMTNLPTLEYENLETDVAAMQWVSQMSGGEHMLSDAKNINAFIESMLELPDEVMRQKSSTVWNSSWFGWIMFALLLVEWTLRRKWSLP